MSNLENVSVESMKAEIKRREARQHMQALTENFDNVKNTLSRCATLAELVSHAKHLVYLYQSSNAILSPPTGKRGRKAKTS